MSCTASYQKAIRPREGWKARGWREERGGGGGRRGEGVEGGEGREDRVSNIHGTGTVICQAN